MNPQVFLYSLIIATIYNIFTPMYKNNQNSVAIQIDQYRVLGQHSSSCQGRVYKVEKNGDIFIAKTYSEQQKHNHSFQREIRCFQRVDSKISPKLYDVIRSTNIISTNGSEKGQCLIIEYLDGGDLHSYIARQCFPQKIAKKICKKMVNILDYLNSIKILHRDIKPANILFTAQFELKVIDYGLADIQGSFKNEKVGTANFMAPQVLKYRRTSLASEIFALGVTMFATVMGFYPFENAKYTDPRYRFIIEKKFSEFWKAIQKKFQVQCLPSKQFQKLFEEMVAYDQRKRENTDLIRESQWIQNDYSTQEDLRAFLQCHRNKNIQQQKQTCFSESQAHETKDAYFQIEYHQTTFN